MTPEHEKAIDEILRHRPERGRRDLINCLMAEDHEDLPDPVEHRIGQEVLRMAGIEREKLHAASILCWSILLAALVVAGAMIVHILF